MTLTTVSDNCRKALSPMVTAPEITFDNYPKKTYCNVFENLMCTHETNQNSIIFDISLLS